MISLTARLLSVLLVMNYIIVALSKCQNIFFCENPLPLGTLVLPNSSGLDTDMAIPYYLVATCMKTIAD